MKRRHKYSKKELDQIEEFMVDVMTIPDEVASSSYKRRFYHKNTDLDQRIARDREANNVRTYDEALYGPRRKVAKPAPVAGPSIVIKLPALPFHKVKDFFLRRRPLFIKSFVLLLIIGGAVFGLREYIKYSSHKSIVNDGRVTPTEIFVPSNLPDGYSVGSGTQTLDNGALLYSVYTDKGKLVTITQQAKPEDLADDFFKDATTFTTDYGKAYILQEGDRINAYLISDKTWVLFNSTGASSRDMKLLITAIKPN